MQPKYTTPCTTTTTSLYHSLSTSDNNILYGNDLGSLDDDNDDDNTQNNKDNTQNNKRKQTQLFMPKEPFNPNDEAKDPLVNDLRLGREALQNCPSIWLTLSNICPTLTAVVDDYNCDEKVSLTFEQMKEKVAKSAHIFKELGVSPGTNAAIIGENSAQWLIVDHGIQLSGGASAVRGADAPPDEIRYIYSNADAGVCVLQGPGLLRKLADDAREEGLDAPLGLESARGPVEQVLLMHREKYSDEDLVALVKSYGNMGKVKVSFFSSLLESAPGVPDSQFSPPPPTATATIVYTSGTTGRPKGVTLSHSNLLHQLGHRLSPTSPYEATEPLPGETMLSLLPVWHITERTFELWQFTRGCKVVYSSIRTFRDDLARHRPQWMVLVPRVLEKVAAGVQAKFKAGSAAQRAIVEVVTRAGVARNGARRRARGLVEGVRPPTMTARVGAWAKAKALGPVCALGDKLVWSKVKAGFGGRQKVIISGGSALAGGLETFYDVAGIPIIVGYGLTETSPLIAHRRLDANLVVGGCVGTRTFQTEVKVVDQETRKEVPVGSVGVVLARGPQVMQGYYKNPEATAKAIDADGFFDTGDLGKVNVATGDIILTGRCKDTIVLSNGENVEPQPLEDNILSGSELVEQVMLTGDDGRRLLAVTVVSLDALARAGLVGKEDARRYSKLVEVMNDPKFDAAEAAEAQKELDAYGERLRSDKAVVAAVQADLKASTGVANGFRKWESVQDAFVVAEPFAMSNGLLTQSFKVKRAEVAKRYSSE
mmetsp:Transcript_10851/g.21596  ORF Transcript_10851/g.21596 Transcript_10851/m.21596 type:complete len:767 (-) Transcript_10851:35-2335(-)